MSTTGPMPSPDVIFDTLFAYQKSGALKTAIDLDLFSDAPTSGPWKVEAKDVASLSGNRPYLAFELDRDEGQNGERLHLTITALREGEAGGAEFMIVSTLGSRASYAFGFVAN